MKTAISIPDEVFKRAEAHARRTRQSRSHLYAQALREYLLRHETGTLTESMKHALESAGAGPDPFVKAAGERTLRQIEWKD